MGQVIICRRTLSIKVKSSLVVVTEKHSYYRGGWSPETFLYAVTVIVPTMLCCVGTVLRSLWCRLAESCKLSLKTYLSLPISPRCSATVTNIAMWMCTTEFHCHLWDWLIVDLYVTKYEKVVNEFREYSIVDCVLERCSSWCQSLSQVSTNCGAKAQQTPSPCCALRHRAVSQNWPKM